MLGAIVGAVSAAAAGVGFYPPTRNWVKVQWAKLSHTVAPVAPGTAPGSTSATTAPKVPPAGVNTIAAPPVVYDTDFGIKVTFTPGSQAPNLGSYTASWFTPDGRGSGNPVYGSIDAAKQGALDLIQAQYLAQPWDPTTGAALPAGALPTAVATSPAAMVPTADLSPFNPSLNPSVAQGGYSASQGPSAGAQLVPLITPQGIVNAYVEADPNAPGNFMVSFQMPGDSSGKWEHATGASAQAAADSAKTTLALLVH